MLLLFLTLLFDCFFELHQLPKIISSLENLDLVGFGLLLLPLKLLLKDEPSDLIIILLLLHLLNFINSMQAFINNRFELRAYLEVGEDIVNGAQNILVIVGKHLNQNSGEVVEHLGFNLEVEL